MARDLQESVDNLSREMRDWSHLFTNAFNTPTARYNAILDSLASGQNAIRRQRIIDLDSRLASMARMRRDSQDLFDGLAMMRARPNAFSRPGQAVNLFKDYQSTRFGQKIASLTEKYGRGGAVDALNFEIERKLLSIRNPEAARRQALVDEWGDNGADRILQAEADVDFNAKLEAARTKGIIEAQKRRQAGFDRGHNAEIRARLRQMHDAKAFRYAIYDTDERNIRTLMDSHRSWNRGQAEQVYFQQLTENTKWLRLIGRNNPVIARNLIPIAKTVGKASGLPIIGAFAKNPALAAITAAIGGIITTVNEANKSNEVVKNWRNYENLYGKPTTQQEWNARLAGIKDPAKMAEIYGQLAVNFGGDPDTFLLSQGMAMRGMSREQKQLHAKAFGLTPEMVRLAEIYAGAAPEQSDIVDAKLHALENEERKGWRTGSGFKATARSMALWVPGEKSLEARGTNWLQLIGDIGSFGIGYLERKALGALGFGGDENKWDEVRDTAEIDDRYRAGMYDNSVTNNNGGERSITVIQNVNAQVENKDALGFMRDMANLGSRSISECQSIVENTDSKRIN